MTTTILSELSPTGLAIERRRPDRKNYTNRHLIQLLRNPADARDDLVDRPGLSKDHGDFGFDRDEEAMLNGTVSPFDGASQLGNLSRPVSSDRHGWAARGNSNHIPGKPGQLRHRRARRHARWYHISRKHNGWRRPPDNGGQSNGDMDPSLQREPGGRAAS